MPAEEPSIGVLTPGGAHLVEVLPEEAGHPGEEPEGGEVPQGGRDRRGHVVGVDGEAAGEEDDEDHDEPEEEGGQAGRHYRAGGELHYTTLHYTTLHYTTLHFTTLHYTSLHYTTLHYTSLHYTTLRDIMTCNFFAVVINCDLQSVLIFDADIRYMQATL